MSTQQLEHEKLSLITWIAELQDSKLIQKLKEFQTKNNDIPQWQKDELDKRMEAIENGTMELLDWVDVKKDLLNEN